jgi:hypothetical protein
MAPDEKGIADAILSYVQRGDYPDTEEIVSADVAADALPSLLVRLDTARDEVKV